MRGEDVERFSQSRFGSVGDAVCADLGFMGLNAG